MLKIDWHTFDDVLIDSFTVKNPIFSPNPWGFLCLWPLERIYLGRLALNPT
jgi:hypothetical protein